MSIYTLTGLSKEQWIRDDPNTPANHKTFDLGNGKKRHIISSRPLHYWTEVGKGEHPDKAEWDDIDTTLRLEAVEGKEYSSHFIADKNNFSTGYRADGSSYKFAGFRLNEANQYETTLHAVYLDGVEIPIPETLIITQVEQNVLEHAISESVKIWNVVHPRYVRDAIKTTQYIQDFRIVYKVHLSGFTILNSHTIVDGVNEYQPNTKGDFVLQSDASAGEKIVTIPKPIMWTDDVDSLNRFCSEINHRLYEQDGVLYYEKAPNSLGRDWLLANKPTLYIDGTAYYGAPSNDAVFLGSGTSWDAIHDATSGTVITDNTTALFGSSYSKNTYYIYRQCHEFDTSGIGDDAKITAASLYLKCADATYASAVLNVFQGFQATPPTGGDYDAFGDTSFGRSSGDWAIDTYKSIALNSSGISAINKTGTTKLFFRDDYDLNDEPPSGPSTIKFYMADYSGTDSDPYLDVSTGANVFYSVCPFGTGNLLSGGSPTIEVDSSGNAVVTLNGASLVDNIGQGVAVEYNSEKYFISEITDLTHFKLVDALGVQAPQQANTALTSVHHEYASISAAIAGAMDADHLGSNDLTGIMLNIPYYYDHDDYTPINSITDITGYTGAGPDNHIRLYAAAGGEQSIRDQRSRGLWDVERAMIYQSGTDYAIINRLPYTEIIGLQIYAHYRAPIFNNSANYVVIDQCILWHGASFDAQAILAEGDGVRISNTVGIQERSDKVFRLRGHNEIVYNNIAIGGAIGFSKETGASALVVNNIAVGQSTACFSGFSGAFAAGSDYNVSSDATAPGAHSLLNQLIADLFVDPENHDYRPKAGANTINAGIGPALDSNVPTTDIAGTPRSGDTCDIGAFEFVDAGGTYIDLAGSINTPSQLTASLKRYIGMAGSANFTFSAENALKATRKVQGTLETSGSLDGTTKVARGISGLINAKADMSLAIGFMVNLSGIIEAGGDAAGQIKIVKDILGNVSSTSSLAGVVKPFRGMDGNILIPSSLNGTSKATRNLIGASETVSDLAASLKPIRGISGVIDSRAEVAGFTSIFKTIIGAIASKANLSAALELFGTIEFSGSISTKGEMASNLRLNLSLSGEVTTAPSLKGNIRTFKTLSGALETVASIVGDAMRIQGFSGDIASATSIEGYLVRDRVLSGAITSSIDVNGKVKIILYFSGSMDSLASLIASLSTFIPSTLGNPIDVSIVSVSTQRELYSITIKRTLTEV